MVTMHPVFSSMHRSHGPLNSVSLHISWQTFQAAFSTALGLGNHSRISFATAGITLIAAIAAIVAAVSMRFNLMFTITTLCQIFFNTPPIEQSHFWLVQIMRRGTSANGASEMWIFLGFSLRRIGSLAWDQLTSRV